MSDIPNIPGKRDLQKLTLVRHRRDVSGATERGVPVAPVEIPGDAVQLSKRPQVLPEDLERYVSLLNEMPEEQSDQAKISRVKSDLASGAYGDAALQGTVDGIAEDFRL